jgi:hypothetical protein
MKERIRRINQLLTGWSGYFGIGRGKSAAEGVEEQLRTRLRIIKWKEWKRTSTRVAALIQLGVSKAKAYQHANTRKSYARTAHSPILMGSLTNAYFTANGLASLSKALLDKRTSYLMNRHMPNGTYGGVRGQVAN